MPHGIWTLAMTLSGPAFLLDLDPSAHVLAGSWNRRRCGGSSLGEGDRILDRALDDRPQRAWRMRAVAVDSRSVRTCATVRCTSHMPSIDDRTTTATA
jgi:hypothetical protein